MSLTSPSLLDRLKRAPSDSPDWKRLNDLYLPLITSWLAGVLGVPEEADDLAQEVLIVVAREIPKFDRQRNGSFRKWLRQIAVHKSLAFFKKHRRRRQTANGGDIAQALAQLEDPHSDLSLQWDRDHDQHVFQKLLDAVRGDFDPKTWEAFSRFAIEGKKAAIVAEELRVTVNMIIHAKSRVLQRLREEAGDFTS